MKKLIFGLLMFCCFVSKAQTTFPLIAGDTLTNADTVTKILPVSAGYGAVGIQVNLKKLSGTVAGKAYLFQSEDGANYHLVDSSTYTAYQTGSMFTGTGTHYAWFNKVSPGTYKYLINVVSSGTVSAQVRVSYSLRKHD